MNNVEVENIKELEDGSALLTINSDAEFVSLLIRTGLRTIIDETSKNVKVLNYTPEVAEIFPACKRYELSDDEAYYLIQIGFLTMIKAGIKRMEENPDELLQKD